MTQNTPILLWHRHDLRLADHPALCWAAKKGCVVPVYIFENSAPHPMGAASKWWLHEALRDLANSYKQFGIDLILRRGSVGEVLLALAEETDARSITWTRSYEPASWQNDQDLENTLKVNGLEVKIHGGYTLFEPERIHTNGGTPFKVFTPFSKACFSAPDVGAPLSVPDRLQGTISVATDSLDDWSLVPRKAVWPESLAANWIVGEKAAHEKLHYFIENILSNYKTGRDRPDHDYTSRLSPYLHFGQISPRQVWARLRYLDVQLPQSGGNIERYLLELLWREFSWHLIHNFPSMLKHPLNPAFKNFPWKEDETGLVAWQKGLTGYPIVDAGMRQLWQTGWMHNRVRMIVASFLIKDLLIDWRQGMSWFWDTLVDADLGSNTASWQWVAGCGADAAPYFRIFNPVLQGLKFDPHGDYVRRYIPELGKLDTAYIHEPWKAPLSALSEAGISLGTTYPRPIIDHARARERALAALAHCRHGTLQTNEIKDLFG